MKMPRIRIRYADVAATLALVMAGGGTAYAVTTAPPNSVNTAAIQDGAVTTPKLAQLSVNGGKLVDGAVGVTKLRNDSVTAAKIVDGSVTSAEILDGSVTAAKILGSAVTNSKILDGSVSTGKIADSAVTSAKILNNSVTATDIAGADITGAISASLSAHSCGNLLLSVSGANVGDAVLISWEGATSPAAFVLAPARVTSAGHIEVIACNEAGTSVSFSNQGIRVMTFR